MKRLFFMAVIAIALFAAAGCKSQQGLTNEERARLDADQQRFRQQVFE